MARKINKSRPKKEWPGKYDSMQAPKHKRSAPHGGPAKPGAHEGAKPGRTYHMDKHAPARGERRGSRPERAPHSFEKKAPGIACRMARISGTYGFAQPVGATGREEDIFIPGRFLMGALPGDEVTVALSPNPRREGSREGTVTAITGGEGLVTGVLMHDGARMWLLPDFCPQMMLAVAKEYADAAMDGQKAACLPLHRGEDYDDHVFSVELCFGDAQAAAACAGAILHQNGISTAFPDRVLTAASILQKQAGPLSVTHPDCIGAQFGPDEAMARLDLRGHAIFTIDSASTKDIDDAVDISVTESGWELGVHIADVSHYVRPYSAIDKEALARGTSVYYADQVIPMLPRELSNDLCSLNAGVERLAFSCIMQLDKQANVTDFRFAKSVIRSRVKGVYTEINRILAGESDPELDKKYKEVAHELTALNDVYELLHQKRAARGSMDIESDESYLILDEKGRCVGVEKRSRGVSECIIEECMILANGCAARLAREKHLPFVYRAHTVPEAQRVDNLKAVLTALNVPFRFAGETPTQPELSALLDATRGTSLEPAVHTAVLRTMAKADYRPEPIGHYGLALVDYAHFTSPIRRYPDLAIHRILSNYLESGAENTQQRFHDFAARASEQSSARELAAVSAERSCEDCYKAEYMRGQIGRSFEGVITSVTSFGVYVMLENTVEGLVRAEALCAGAPQIVEGVAMSDPLTGRRWSVGDALPVLVAAVNVPQGQIDFVPVPADGSAPVMPAPEKKPAARRPGRPAGAKKPAGEKRASGGKKSTSEKKPAGKAPRRKAESGK